MAKKKTEEVVVNEEVQEVVVEEKPKSTRKSSKKKVEEPVAEEPKVEEPVVEEPKAEEPKAEEPKAKKPKAKPAEPAKEDKSAVIKADIAVDASDFTSYTAVVSANGVLPIRKAPSMLSNKIGSLAAGAKVVVLEVDGNWARIGKDRWVNINYIAKS